MNGPKNQPPTAAEFATLGQYLQTVHKFTAAQIAAALGPHGGRTRQKIAQDLIQFLKTLPKGK
jgi:hypothetical protein